MLIVFVTILNFVFALYIIILHQSIFCFRFSNGAANTIINTYFVFATGAAMLEKRERETERER